jgi:hypothetical protein
MWNLLAQDGPTAAGLRQDGAERGDTLYLGCRCPACGLVAVYGDWKNEFNGYRELLAKV